MATLHPFRAVRPLPDKAADIVSVPYDVINSQEARQLAEGKPLSFLHIIRPEIDLEPGVDEHADIVYEKGADNLHTYVEGANSLQEDAPALYVYRLIMDGRSQTGIFGCASVADYDDNVILKHEKTRPDKEDDRTRHIVMQRAHAEPVMLTFRGSEEIAALMAGTMEQDPLYDLMTGDGILHTVWRVEQTEALVAAFQKIPNLYVADGHHRCKAASRTAEALAHTPGVTDEVTFFPAVFFPMDQMNIMAYNRIIRKVPEGPAPFLEGLRAQFELTQDASPEPASKGDISLYIQGTWYGLTLPQTKKETVADRLDVGMLTEYILEPILGITDPRRDPNIGFVGGIRGTEELEKLVNAGEADLAISMFPTSIRELLAVSDARMLMPPKSTWFEPKLRSGFLVHVF